MAKGKGSSKGSSKSGVKVANLPSKTGQPSGPKRGNAPPKK